MDNNEKTYNPGFSERLTSLMASAGMSNSELAEKIGKSPDTVRDYKNEKRCNPSEGTLKKIAAVLNTTPGYLRTGRLRSGMNNDGTRIERTQARNGQNKSEEFKPQGKYPSKEYERYIAHLISILDEAIKKVAKLDDEMAYAVLVREKRKNEEILCSLNSIQFTLDAYDCALLGIEINADNDTKIFLHQMVRQPLGVYKKIYLFAKHYEMLEATHGQIVC